MATASPSASAQYSPINDPTQIIISIDLKQAAIEHLSYLKEYYGHPEYLQKQAREYAVYRYETFWLPFLAENSDLDIVPPLDVHFVWHSHMLAPITYASDCERLFGRILPNNTRSRLPPIVKFSEQLWTKKYARTMPYDINYATNVQVIPPYTSKIKYALSQAVERQAEFYYNVALSHYKDPEFLEQSLTRYKKFLFLKRLNPSMYIVPMYDIDVIWHTHQLFPEEYRRDMMANLQHVLHHDDTTQDRSVNSKLSTSDHDTRHKWSELYGDRLPKNGCMYRGKTSKGFYQQVDDFKFLVECQRYTMYVQFIDNQPAATGVTKKDVDHKVNTVVPLHDQPVGEIVRDQFFAQFNSSEQELFARGSSDHVEAHFEADFNDFTAQLTLKIQKKAGYWPMNYFSSLAEFPISADKLTPILEFSQPVQAANQSTGEDDPTALYYIFDKDIERDSPLHQLVPNAKRYVAVFWWLKGTADACFSIRRLIAGVPAVDINTVIVRLEFSSYEETLLDTNYLAQLGPTFLFNLENVKVKQALHNIQPIHQDQPILLNIRHTIINDIDIFTATFNSAIFASCHTLNWSQLPLPDQVSSRHDSSVITLNPEKEEALIIKDHTGDWGIVKFNQDLFTASLEDATNEKNYQFTLFRFMPDGRVEEEIIYVDWEDDKWLIGSNNFGIEMNTWSISVKRIELKNSMQYICLGAALITRFDVLFTEIFGKRDELSDSTATYGNENDQDLLSNEIGKMKLNGSHLTTDSDSVSGGKASRMSMNNV